MNPVATNSTRGIYVTGSDTEVGKTWIACKLIGSLMRCVPRVGAYKPVASGIEELEDSDPYLLWKQIGSWGEIDDICPQRFSAALAPMYAAEREGRRILHDVIWKGWEHWKTRCDFLVVEGAGGLLSPIDNELTNADLALHMGYPLLVVVPNRLGAINQSLLTLEVAFRRQLNVAALILNDNGMGLPGAQSAEHLRSIRLQLERSGIPCPLMLESGFHEDSLSGIDKLVANILSPANLP